MFSFTSSIFGESKSFFVANLVADRLAWFDLLVNGFLSDLMDEITF